MGDGKVDHVRRAARSERVEADVSAVEVKPGDLGRATRIVAAVEHKEVLVESHGRERQALAGRAAMPINDPPKQPAASHDPRVSGDDPTGISGIKVPECG